MSTDDSGPEAPAPGADATGPEDPPGDLLAALSVRRNVGVGLAVGLGVAALAYAVRVLELFGPAPARGSPALFLGLALVLATTVAALVATLLSAVSAYRLASQGGE